MNKQVVKVQAPLGSNVPGEQPALVYAEGRQMMVTQPFTAALVKALRGDPKGYFEATWSGKAWTIGARVADENW